MCEICFHVKQTRRKFALSKNKAKSVFELIHCDICGPYTVPSSSGAHYFFTIIDDASRATWVYLMHERGETSHLKILLSWPRLNLGKILKL